VLNQGGRSGTKEWENSPSHADCVWIVVEEIENFCHEVRSDDCIANRKAQMRGARMSGTGVARK